MNASFAALSALNEAFTAPRPYQSRPLPSISGTVSSPSQK
jgi:hypothetical protein